MRNLMQLFVAMAIAVMVTSCGKSDNGGAAPLAVNSGYYLSNGVCYDANNNSIDATNCSSLAYQISGTQCLQAGTNQAVSLANCTNNVYFFSGSTCYDANTLQAVTSTLCTNDGSNVNNGTAGSTRYQQTTNGQCVDTYNNNMPVNPSLCTNQQNPGNSGFYQVGNYCISAQTQQPVNPVYCQNQGQPGVGNGFQYINGVCVDSQYRRVPEQYCVNSNTPGTPGIGSQTVCQGQYIYQNPNTGAQQVVFCSSQTRNCSGQTLVHQQSRVIHRCL